jgi:hypothetical protein
LNIFRKQKQDEIIEDETVQAPDSEIAEPDKETEQASVPPVPISDDSRVTVFERHSRRHRSQKNPREYIAFETGKSPRWIDIHFANGRRVLVSHFDVKRVDSMTPEVVSIFCSDCLIRLEGKNLHRLVDEFERIRRITAFDDRKFDAVQEDVPLVEVIKLTEIYGSKPAE